MNNENQIENLYDKILKESSPLDLDNLILNQAKQSCKKTDKSKTLKRWIYALPTAAVLMISLTVVINLQNQNQDFRVTPNYSSIDERHKKNLRPTIAPPLEPHPSVKKATKENEQRLNRKSIKNKRPQALLIEEEATNLSRTKKEEKIKDFKQPTFGIINKQAAPSQEPISAPEGIAEAVIIDKNRSERDSISNLSSIDETQNINLEKVITTGSRVRISDLKTPDDIKKLEKLILNKRFAKAKRLLNELKEKYHDYDFSELEQLID